MLPCLDNDLQSILFIDTRDFKIQERGRHQRRRSRVGPVSRTPCLWREK